MINRWDMYIRARKPINNCLVIGCIFYILLLLGYYTHAQYDVFAAVFGAAFFGISYYRYLDDIFFKKIGIHRGYISNVYKSKYMADFDMIAPYVLNHSITCITYNKKEIFYEIFDCYYKRMWKDFRVGEKVEITYLMESGIIVDLKILDKSKDENSISINELQNSKRKWIKVPTGKKLTAQEKIMRALRGLIFSTITALTYIGIVYMAQFLLNYLIA